ncbi:MAG TPA: hypothetical protein VGZ04_02460 [Acidimicrobiales bacterium]|jgi:hypothetical protein|nr:hypothetical protein [Acidimicrobiales bacterium]
MSTAPDLEQSEAPTAEAPNPLAIGGVSPLKELRFLTVLTGRRLRQGSRPWLGLVLACVTALVALMLRFHVMSPDLWRSGAVYASLPLKSELARLPMSLFLPTPYLPAWAASGQILIVFGLGEMILGRWLTVVVATLGHFGSSLVAFVLLNAVHQSVFGLTPALAHALDTGPSAATTAVGACLLVAVRMKRSAWLLTLALVAAALIAPGIDGVEHIVALVCGLAAGGVYRIAFSLRTRHENLSSRSRRSYVVLGLAQVFRLPRSAVAAIRGRN